MEIAEGKQFYQKNGLQTVNIVGFGTQAADQIALLLGGHAQFLDVQSSLYLHSESNNPDMISLMNIRTGGSVSIVVSDAEASKLHIPSANTTEADVKAQLAALRGSGLEIGVPSETGDNYSDVVGVAKSAGLKVGPGGDITVSSLGGTANLQAAFQAGKVSAFSQTAPQTYVPNTVRIPLYMIPPASDQTFTQLVTTRAYEQAHPDVVQAVVDSYLEAMQYALGTPRGAVQYLSSAYKQAGTPASLNYTVFSAAVPQFGTPVINQAMFNASIALADNTGKVSVNFQTAVNNSFVIKGITSLKLPYPTSS